MKDEKEENIHNRCIYCKYTSDSKYYKIFLATLPIHFPLISSDCLKISSKEAALYSCQRAENLTSTLFNNCVQSFTSSSPSSASIMPAHFPILLAPVSIIFS